MWWSKHLFSEFLDFLCHWLLRFFPSPLQSASLPLRTIYRNRAPHTAVILWKSAQAREGHLNLAGEKMGKHGRNKAFWAKARWNILGNNFLRKSWKEKGVAARCTKWCWSELYAPSTLSAVEITQRNFIIAHTVELYPDKTPLWGYIIRVIALKCLHGL